MLEAIAAPIEPNIGIRVKSNINVNATPIEVAMTLIRRFLLAKGMMERTLDEQANKLPMSSIFNKRAVSENSSPKIVGMSNGDNTETTNESMITAVPWSLKNRKMILILNWVNGFFVKMGVRILLNESETSQNI
tara:strand:- start:197 stop:598 length:402 start_codon:yes stop_codon:yes gene_type:complete